MCVGWRSSAHRVCEWRPRSCQPVRGSKRPQLVGGVGKSRPGQREAATESEGHASSRPAATTVAGSLNRQELLCCAGPVSPHDPPLSGTLLCVPPSAVTPAICLPCPMRPHTRAGEAHGTCRSASPRQCVLWHRLACGHAASGGQGVLACMRRADYSLSQCRLQLVHAPADATRCTNVRGTDVDPPTRRDDGHPLVIGHVHLYVPPTALDADSDCRPVVGCPCPAWHLTRRTPCPPHPATPCSPQLATQLPPPPGRRWWRRRQCGRHPRRLRCAPHVRVVVRHPARRREAPLLLLLLWQPPGGVPCN